MKIDLDLICYYFCWVLLSPPELLSQPQKWALCLQPCLQFIVFYKVTQSHLFKYSCYYASPLLKILKWLLTTQIPQCGPL